MLLKKQEKLTESAEIKANKNLNPLVQFEGLHLKLR